MAEQEIINKIEILRSQIKELVQQRGTFNDDDVIKKSQELDSLLNQYNNLRS